MRAFPFRIHCLRLNETLPHPYSFRRAISLSRQEEGRLCGRDTSSLIPANDIRSSPGTCRPSCRSVPKVRIRTRTAGKSSLHPCHKPGELHILVRRYIAKSPAILILDTTHKSKCSKMCRSPSSTLYILTGRHDHPVPIYNALHARMREFRPKPAEVKSHRRPHTPRPDGHSGHYYRKSSTSP